MTPKSVDFLLPLVSTTFSSVEQDHHTQDTIVPLTHRISTQNQVKTQSSSLMETKIPGWREPCRKNVPAFTMSRLSRLSRVWMQYLDPETFLCPDWSFEAVRCFAF